MTTEQRQHLVDLRQCLKDLPPEDFDMHRFKQVTPCQTKWCIAGWYAEKFPERLRLKSKFSELYNQPVFFLVDPNTNKLVARGTLAEHFGITRHQAFSLFYDWGQTLEGAITMIDEILAPTPHPHNATSPTISPTGFATLPTIFLLLVILVLVLAIIGYLSILTSILLILLIIIVAHFTGSGFNIK